jgi:hypothetical protein
MDFGSFGERIRVYTDDSTNEPSQTAQSAIARAETLVFLGFYYNERNLELIKPQSATLVKRIFGTAFGRSDADMDAIRKDLGEFLWKRPYYDTPDSISALRMKVQLVNQKCFQLFDTYSASLPRQV